MNRDLPEFGFGFDKTERFNPEAATEGALWKRMFVKNSQNSQQNTCVAVSFLSKRDKCFPVSFWIFLITASLIKYLWATAFVNLYPLEFISVFTDNR